MIAKTIYRMPDDNQCPCCNTKLTAAIEMNCNERPMPDDVTMCDICTSILKWDNDLRLVALTEAEVDAIEEPERSMLARMRTTIQSFHRIQKDIPHAER